MANEATATNIAFTRVANGTLARSATGSPALWSFAVDYGDTTYVCVSWEEAGSLYLGLVDVAAGPDSTGAWPVTSRTNLTAAMGTSPSPDSEVADHWHIFALGFHVITFSTDSANELYLLVVDPNTFAIVIEMAVVGPNASDFAVELPTGAQTNDHYCVQYDDASVVAVALGSTAGGSVGMRGQLVYLVDMAAETVTELGEFADAAKPFVYQSSALRVASSDPCSAATLGLVSGTGYEWQVVATGLLDSTGANTLYLLATEDLETPVEMKALTRTTRSGDHELAMGTQVLFANGWRLLMFRDRDASAATSSTGSDAGRVLWRLLDENLDMATWYSETVPGLFTLGGGRLANRPHAARWSDGTTDYLLVGFDTSMGALLRAYAIGYS